MFLSEMRPVGAPGPGTTSCEPKSTKYPEMPTTPNRLVGMCPVMVVLFEAKVEAWWMASSGSASNASPAGFQNADSLVP